MGLFKSKEEKFWQWFEQNEAMLFDFEKNQESVFSQINSTLKEINKEITFTFGPIREGKREFIISADGISALIPTVQKLVEKAPNLEKWNIIAFRPAGSGPCNIEINGIKISDKDISFDFLEEVNGKIGLDLHIKGKETDQDIYQFASFIFLDHCIGEYEVMTKVGTINIDFDFKKGTPIEKLAEYWKQKKENN